MAGMWKYNIPLLFEKVLCTSTTLNKRKEILNYKYNRARTYVCQRKKHPNKQAFPAQYSDNIYFSVFIFSHVLPFSRLTQDCEIAGVTLL